MNVISFVVVIIITSLYYFPFNCSLLPAVNTKMALAAIGLLLFAINSSVRRDAEAEAAFVKVSVWASLVSFVGLFSALVNNSGDYTYASYIVSAWVWMGGAYTVIKCIEIISGKVTLRLLTIILAFVCVSQCILSQIISNNAVIAGWIDGFIVSTGFMGKVEGRLYGIGCALDVAGLKFCAVLILLAYFAIHPSRKINVYLETVLYFIAFVIIGVFGSMISRTTSIGVVIALVFWLLTYLFKHETDSRGQYRYLGQVMFASIVLFVPIMVFFYRTNPTFHENLRFGFEGFFSLVEIGEWKVRSNGQLMSMWVWPDNPLTWLIGDGYFSNPLNSNPYYIGSAFTDYYMGADVGYCRFVFYFGIVGLSVFVLYFINCANCCVNKMPRYSVIFWLLLLMNFIGWNKVSSDLFPIYALLLLLDREPVKL